jgi:hypothetical protein
MTVNSLKEAAEAMDMKLVYAFIPKDGWEIAIGGG